MYDSQRTSFKNKGKLIMTKVYDATEIRNKLITNDKWLIRGILAVYARQTADEKSSLTTKHHNGVGFNGRDAAILSSFAKQILSWEATEDPRYPQPLSPKQFGYARRAMLKYAGQLARIAEENNPVEDDMVQDEFEAEGQAEMEAERAAIMAVERMSELEKYEGELTW
jgi:hypothetical protein